MFVRLVRPEKTGSPREFLVNTNHISLIEVGYVTESGWHVGMRDPTNMADAVRTFRFTISGETFLIAANPNNPVGAVFDDIFKQATKG